MKEIAIGITDFKDFLDGNNYYYVDKTSFIKEVVSINNKTFDVNLILRPRRFGKTLNQSMLRCFFDPKEAECKPLFKDLEISKDKEFCDKFQNKVPVIMLNQKH